MRSEHDLKWIYVTLTNRRVLRGVKVTYMSTVTNCRFVAGAITRGIYENSTGFYTRVDKLLSVAGAVSEFVFTLLVYAKGALPSTLLMADVPLYSNTPTPRMIRSCSLLHNQTL